MRLVFLVRIGLARLSLVTFLLDLGGIVVLFGLVNFDRGEADETVRGSRDDTAGYERGAEDWERALRERHRGEGLEYCRVSFGAQGQKWCVYILWLRSG